MKIAICAETYPNECRVAATPETAGRIIRELGFEVLVERGAGLSASFSDTAYLEAGCEIIEEPDQLWSAADVILKVRAPSEVEVSRLHENHTLISFLFPGQNPSLLESLASTGATVLAMDAVPRISRAQKMDALSSMANIAGYRAIVEAASKFGRFFTGQITAAGKVPPAKVLVIGAGVAGLAAIGTARGLGAIVRAFDVRPEVADQVKSMGADFLMLDFSNKDGDSEDGGTQGGYAKTMSPEFIAAEMQLFADQAKEVNIIVTTALIPGKKAPTLITKDMVESMKPGSVVVDLATEQGGNCEVSEPDQVIQHSGVHIVGYQDLPSRLASTASQLYGTNLFHVLSDLGGSEAFHVNMQDDVIRSMTVAKSNEVTWPPPPVAVAASPTMKASHTPSPNPAQTTTNVSASSASVQENAKKSGSVKIGTNVLAIALAALCLTALGFSRDNGLLSDIMVFTLACIVGWQVIWSVTPSLHTPLMSVTNAISGIIIVGGMVQAATTSYLASMLGAAAIFFATINIAGGFLVTQRMLRMFHK